MAADPRFDFTTLIATYPILTQANASVATSRRFFEQQSPAMSSARPSRRPAVYEGHTWAWLYDGASGQPLAGERWQV